MKQASVKTLGAAALGAAIAAVTAGTASAAVTDGVQHTADDVVRTLPLDDTARTLPAESRDVVRTGSKVLSGQRATKVPLVDDTLAHTTGSDSSSPAGKSNSGRDGLLQPATELLGGLPVDPTSAMGLPTGDLLRGLNIG